MERDRGVDIGLGWGYKRDYMGDMPELLGVEMGDGTRHVTPQQMGFITEGGVPVQIPYNRALNFGLIDETEERWSMTTEDYLRENGL